MSLALSQYIISKLYLKQYTIKLCLILIANLVFPGLTTADYQDIRQMKRYLMKHQLYINSDDHPTLIRSLQDKRFVPSEELFIFFILEKKHLEPDAMNHDLKIDFTKKIQSGEQKKNEPEQKLTHELKRSQDENHFKIRNPKEDRAKMNKIGPVKMAKQDIFAVTGKQIDNDFGISTHLERSEFEAEREQNFILPEDLNMFGDKHFKQLKPMLENWYLRPIELKQF